MEGCTLKRFPHTSRLSGLNLNDSDGAAGQTLCCPLPAGVCLLEDAVLVGAQLTAGGHAVLAGVAEPGLGGVLRGRAHDGVALAVHAVAACAHTQQRVCLVSVCVLWDCFPTTVLIKTPGEVIFLVVFWGSLVEILKNCMTNMDIN